MWWLVCIGCSTLAISALWLHAQTPSRRRMRFLVARIPGPKPLPLLGNALLFMVRPKETLNILTRLIDQYGDYTRLWLGSDVNVIVKNPADVKLILTSNKVTSKGPSYEFMKKYLGPGLVTGGPTWRNHRKIISPSYGKKPVEHYNTVFNEEAQQLAEVLYDKNPNGIFNVYKDMVKTTTQCICRTLMGLPKEESQSIYRLDEAIDTTEKMYHHLYMKMVTWWLQIPLVYWLVGAKKIEDNYIKIANDLASDIVEKRRKALKNNNIAVSADKDEVFTGAIDRMILSGELTYPELVQETATIFTSSQETSAKMASVVLMIMAHLPDWQERVYKEIIDVLGPDDTFVSVEDVKRLQYLDMVYKEALRYTPQGAIIQRTVEEEIVIKNGEIILPIGTSLSIPIYHLHRDPRSWEDPDEVKPERFLPENAYKLDPNAFLPFSNGPMECLGRHFAAVLIKVLVVRVLRRVILEAKGHMSDLEQHVAVSVKFVKGYNMRVRPRHNESP